MAETNPTNTALNAETVATEVERKQSQRLAIAGAISIVTNIAFLVGAANGMNEKPLSLEQPPPVYVTFEAVPTPAPVATPAPVVTPAPKQVAQAEPTPAPRRKETVSTPPPPRPKIQVAQVKPKPPVIRDRPKQTEVTPPEVEPTPPPEKPVEETVAEAKEKPVETKQTKGAETEVTAKASQASASASNAGAAASAPAGGQRARVAQGVAGASATDPGDFTSPSASRDNATGAPSLRTGIAGGSNAAGTSGIVGETRSTGSIIGSAGNISGPQLMNSSGPKLGTMGGKSGARDKILTQSESAGGAASGDFTVANGTGLRPGAIVARTGTAGGGAPGTLSNATLGARVSGGGNGSGSGGSESLGIFRKSVGPGGGSGGPVGLRVGTGPGAGSGSGAMSGVANGDNGGVSGQGLAGGNGAPGRGDARVTGAGGGNGSGIAGGSARGGKGNAIGDGDGNGSTGGRGPNTGPGGNGKGVVGRNDGVGSGTGGSGTGAGEFGVKGGVGNGAKINGKGTGTATGQERTAISVDSGTKNGAGIVTQKVGQIENKTGNGPIQVKTDDKEDNRKVAGPSAGTLSNKVDISGFTAKTEAKIRQRSRPRITDEMKAAAERPVRVEFTVGANGSASYKILTSSGSKDVDDAVLAACAGYKWTAATSGGTPVESKQIVIFDPKE